MIAVTKGGNWRLVSDAMAACGLGDGSYLLGSQKVDVADGIARLRGSSAIAGSIAALADGVRWCVTNASVPLVNAVAAASWQAAHQIGLKGVGGLATGEQADLVVLDEHVRVVGVMQRGVWR